MPFLKDLNDMWTTEAILNSYASEEGPSREYTGGVIGSMIYDPVSHRQFMIPFAEPKLQYDPLTGEQSISFPDQSRYDFVRRLAAKREASSYEMLKKRGLVR